MARTIDYLYDSLKGNTRIAHGELYVDGFMDEDYEALFFELTKELAPLTHDFGGDFMTWYATNCRRYHQYLLNHRRTYGFYDPFVEIAPEDHSLRQRLALLKWVIYRRKYSRHGQKEA